MSLIPTTRHEDAISCGLGLPHGDFATHLVPACGWTLAIFNNTRNKGVTDFLDFGEEFVLATNAGAVRGTELSLDNRRCAACLPAVGGIGLSAGAPGTDSSGLCITQNLETESHTNPFKNH
jgi:hypothetical protein